MPLARSLALATFFSTTLAAAQQPIAIPTTVPYTDGVGTPDMKAQCDWNTKLTEHVVENAKVPVTRMDDPITAQGAVLTMQITSVHSAGGGNFSGPKWGEIRGELKQNGQIVGSFVDMRTVTQSAFTFTACGILERVGKSIGRDVAKWLENPTMDAKLGNSR